MLASPRQLKPLSQSLLQKTLSHTPFSAVVFGGGGARGWAYLGALSALKELGVDWGARKPPLREAAGTSIGAVTALAVVLGFSVDELTEFFAHTDELQLVSLNAALLVSGARALNDGSAMREHVSRMIRAKLGVADVTLGELRARTGMALTVATYELEGACTLHLGSFATPDLSTVEAVYASLAVPLVFSPAILLLPPGTRRGKGSVCATVATVSTATASILPAVPAVQTTFPAPTVPTSLPTVSKELSVPLQLPLVSGPALVLNPNPTTGDDVPMLPRHATCVDGGLADNLSMALFAPGSAIGLRLDWEMPSLSRGELDTVYGAALRVFVASLYEMSSLEWRALDAPRRAHTISLRTGPSQLLNLTAADSQAARTSLARVGYAQTILALNADARLLAKLRTFPNPKTHSL